MSIREWVAFGTDLAHILLLSVVYIAGLAAMTAIAYARKAYFRFRSFAGVRSNGRPTEASWNRR
jgi:hypothetical protein